MDTNNIDHTRSADAGAQDINMYHYLQVLAKWRRFLLINIGVVVVAVAVVTFFMPNLYLSTASILPPKQDSGMGGAISQLTKDFLPSGMLGKLGVNQGSYNYLAILNSRSAKDSVVRKFDLINVYDVSHKSMEGAIRELENRCTFEIGENGDITVAVLDEDATRAAAMANYFVEVLNTISIQLSTQEARNNREFLGKRYDQAREDMRMIEDSMKAFQTKYGIYALPEQTKAAIEAAAQIKAQSSIAEVELGILERSLGRDNSQTRLKEMEIHELNSKLRALKFGSDTPTDRDLELFVPFKDVPEVGIRYLRLYREFEIQAKIMQLVIPMYEQAKVEEQKTVPVVLVLDTAVPADKKDRPKRSLLVLTTFIMGFFLFTMIVFLMESLLSRRDSATSVERRVRNGVGHIARWYHVHV